jgi:hypothetical protein
VIIAVALNRRNKIYISNSILFVLYISDQIKYNKFIELRNSHLAHCQKKKKKIGKKSNKPSEIQKFINNKKSIKRNESK